MRIDNTSRQVSKAGLLQYNMYSTTFVSINKLHNLEPQIKEQFQTTLHLFNFCTVNVTGLLIIWCSLHDTGSLVSVL